MTIGNGYTGTDFYCDVAIPGAHELDVVHEDELVQDESTVRALLRVVQDIARDVEQTHGAAAVLTNLGSYQDSKHLHVHVRSGPEHR